MLGEQEAEEHIKSYFASLPSDKRVLAAAKTIAQYNHKNGSSPRESLASITLPNLEEKIGGMTGTKDFKFIDSVIRRKIRNGTSGSCTEVLRKLVKKDLFPNENIANVNRSDLNNQTIINPRISFKKAYFLGVALGDLVLRKSKLQRLGFSGRSTDLEFYQKILIPLIYELTNISTKLKPSKGKLIANIDFYSTQLRDHLTEIGMIDQNNNFYSVDFNNRNLNIDHSRANMYKEAYVMGIIASTGSFREKKIYQRKDLQLTLQDKKGIIPFEFRKIIEELDINITINPKKPSPRIAVVNEENLIQLLDYEPSFRISDEQIGLFSNPYQIDTWLR